MFFQKGYDFTDETDPNSKLNNGESTSVVITDISEVSDIMTAVVYSIVYPTPTPSPTPTPTPVPDKEMILEVEINEVDATNNDIVVSKGDWVRVRASTFDWYDEENKIMESLMVDKITCQIKNRKGKEKYYKELQNSYEGNFALKSQTKGTVYC